jgi:hypothetical protein
MSEHFRECSFFIPFIDRLANFFKSSVKILKSFIADAIESAHSAELAACSGQ